MAVKRTRNYATIVYQESAPDNWLEVLSDLHVPAFVSPVHDRDVNASGELKKAHYHVMIMFDSVKTREQAIEVFSELGGVGCDVINSVPSYARYLCHLDNPEKVRYDLDDVLSFAGVDYIECISLPSDKYGVIGAMIDFVEEQDVISFAELLRWARGNKPDWFRVLCTSGTTVMREYIKSRFWSTRSGGEEGV